MVLLTPGCAWLQTLLGKPVKPAAPQLQAAPAPAPSTLEPKLDAMAGRLERMEQMLAAAREQERQRQRLEEQSRQALTGLRQDVRNTQVAVGGVQKQMKQVAAQQSALTARWAETAAGQADFWAVDVPLGGLPNGGDKQEIRRISAIVPDQAREILVYAQVATGYVKGGPHRFRISVRVQDDREAAFYLYAIGQPQQSWAYNSDNVWLPMPKDRELILRAEGEPFFGDWNSEVRIVGYR